jgi:hypothetical protein
MARGSDEHSGGNSFFIMLGNAPHLDMGYGAFGKVTKGLDVLHGLESLKVRREGIFVMPEERVTILSSYWYRKHGPVHLSLEKKSALAGLARGWEGTQATRCRKGGRRGC